jgi:hypothetical protein
MGELLARLDKNSAEEIEFNLEEYHGQHYLDIRVWLKGQPGENGAETPTKKGIRFNVELLDEFIQALQKINAGMDGEPDVVDVKGEYGKAENQVG